MSYGVSLEWCSYGSVCSFLADVIQIDKTAEFFRLMYDVKGRFTIHRITSEESKVCERCVAVLFSQCVGWQSVCHTYMYAGQHPC